MSRDFAAEYVAGCVAGSSNVLSGYAFDTCKVRWDVVFIFAGSRRCLLLACRCAECGGTCRLQACPPDTYRNAWHCFRSIVKFEGVMGLYRGVSAPLIGGALETGELLCALYCAPDFVLMQLNMHLNICSRRPNMQRMSCSAGVNYTVYTYMLRTLGVCIRDHKIDSLLTI